jgi:lipopolysaccharide transport system permease protein
VGEAPVTALARVTQGQWELRVIFSWAKRDVVRRYRQSALHIVWSILQPISIIAVYAVVFRQILDVDGDGLPYLSFIVIGMVIWRYFSVGLAQSTCLIDQAGIISKIKFRREIVPLSACVGGLVDLAIGTVAAVVVAAFQGIRPGITLLALIPIYVVVILYTATAAVLVSTITVFARDLSLAMPTIQQLLFFATPVMYAIGQVKENFGFIAYVNPFWFLLEAARDVSLRHTWPSAGTLLLHLLVAAGIFAAAIAYLRSIEHRIVDIA